MRQEIIDWVAALRSGKYKQGKQLLRSSDDKYCCLGVLCEVLDIPKDQQDNYYNYGGRNRMLPVEVCNKLNITVSGKFDSAKIDFDERVNTLWEVNDMLKWDFNQIADLIEEIENADAWL